MVIIRCIMRKTSTTLLVIAITTAAIIAAATTSLLNIQSAHAQTATLGEPFFVEKGKVTGQKEIGPNRTQLTFTSNGTMNGNIEVTNTGEYIGVSKGNNLIDQGHGVITTKDGSETANYTFIEVGNGTAYQGASAHSTNSTGKLSFLNNILGIYKGETDKSGNFNLTHWHWK